MEELIKNLSGILHRFKAATLLNIFGLSIAFASLMIIMMQVDYDYNFDKSHKDFDRIYRVEMNTGGEKFASLVRPVVDRIIQSSPHIVAGTLAEQMFNNDLFFSIENKGAKVNFLEKSTNVYPSFTDVFDFEMLEGMSSALNAPRTVLIPENLSKKLFGKESAIGKQLIEKSGNYTIGGVYKDFPNNSSVENVVYIPMGDKDVDNFGNGGYCAYLKFDSPEVPSDLSHNMKNYLPEDFFEGGNPDDIDLQLQFTPLAELHYVADVKFDPTPKSSRQTMGTLFAIAVVIMIIAGVNFTNFSMAMTPMRIKSINTKKVLGATLSELRFSLITEAVAISLVAYLLSLVWICLLSMSPLNTNIMDVNISLTNHLWLVLVTACISIFFGILSSLYPAIYMTSIQPALVLKGNFGLSLKGRRLRSFLVGIQFVASFALIISIAFMYLQNHFIQNASLGYEKDNLIIAEINKQVIESKNTLTNQLTSYPEIDGVTYSLFLLSSSDAYSTWVSDYQGKQIKFSCLTVDPSFLDVMGIPVVEGRNFREGENNFFIFNEKARQEYNLQLNTKIEANSGEIIGFMPDIKYTSFRLKIEPMAFFVTGYTHDRNFIYVKVKAGNNLHVAMQHVKTSLASIDPDYPFDVRFFDDTLNTTYKKERNLTFLITLFSLVAIIISVTGVFGLVLFESQYRRKEIGIRKVLGSSAGEILSIFTRTYSIILVVCFVIAAPIAYYIISRWLETFAYKTPMYWWVYVVSGLLVFLITIITISIQSWKTAAANPVESIKND